MDSIKTQEKNLIGHAERIIREEEGLVASLDDAFEKNMVFFWYSTNCID